MLRTERFGRNVSKTMASFSVGIWNNICACNYVSCNKPHHELLSSRQLPDPSQLSFWLQFFFSLVRHFSAMFEVNKLGMFVFAVVLTRWDLRMCFNWWDCKSLRLFWLQKLRQVTEDTMKATIGEKKKILQLNPNDWIQLGHVFYHTCIYSRHPLGQHVYLILGLVHTWQEDVKSFQFWNLYSLHTNHKQFLDSTSLREFASQFPTTNTQLLMWLPGCCKSAEIPSPSAPEDVTSCAVPPVDRQSSWLLWWQ